MPIASASITACNQLVTFVFASQALSAYAINIAGIAFAI
jgi:hypothetical protein